MIAVVDRHSTIYAVPVMLDTSMDDAIQWYAIGVIRTTGPGKEPAMQAKPATSVAPAPQRDLTKIPPYEKIRQALISGELTPGQPLVESALADWCEVSRTPVREALTRLEQDGLINRTAKGLVVRERSPEEIMDLYETRIVLEESVARVAAERRNQVDLSNLRGAVARARALVKPDETTMVASNLEFHRAVWRASHNESLSDLLERLNLHLARYPATTLSHPGRWRQALKQHEAILAAIEARDGSTASAQAIDHFSVARDIRLKLWQGGID